MTKLGGWGNQVVGINEGMCCDKDRALYATEESWNTTSKTSEVLYAG